eukprot:TRINITY_DN5904_c0_g1_i1.p1 TRINITY_DN5904_c0_g1~~TRINITY_DN5904_c0_g1_i1.p1  ORF type:complete len:561 (+),score=59.93 TRINITY_DN5904_c0_g1_i1:62-1744(+)
MPKRILAAVRGPFAAALALALRCAEAASVHDVVDYGTFSSATDAKNSTPLLGHGFKPSAIIDPSADIDCEAQACGWNDGFKTTCSDWPERMCLEYEPCGSKVCLHKDVMPLMDDDLALIAAVFFIGIAAGATGIGGGGLNVPMLMLWSRFDIKEAVPLSHAAVMGNALAMLLRNAPQQHPHYPVRPLIHHEMALVLLPAMLGGTNLGVMVGRVFPPAILIILSLCLLAFATTKTMLRGLKMSKARPGQQQQQQQAARLALNGCPLTSPLPDARAVFLSPKPKPWPQLGVEPGMGDDRSADLGGAPPRRTWSGDIIAVGTPQPAMPRPASSQNQVRVPWTVINIMVLANIVFTLDDLAMQKDVTGVRMCTGAWWAIMLCVYPVIAVGIGLGVRSLQQLMDFHRARGEEDLEGEVTVTRKTIILYPLVAALVGLVAGLLGLGGGEFIVPLLLEIGLQTTVASATSGFLMLFTTSSNIVHYFAAGTMKAFLGYSIVMFVTAFLGGTVGLHFRDKPYLRKNTHLVVFLLAGLLLVGGVLLAYRGASTLSEASAYSFQAFCPEAS